LDFTKEIGLEINAERTKYIFISCHQNTGQLYYTYKYSKDVAKFSYLGTIVTNQSYVLEEIKSRLNYLPPFR
jgi:hypothetical protein